MIRKWKDADAMKLRKILDTMIPAAIQEVLGHRTNHRVLYSSITETPLEPEGHYISIGFAVQITEKKDEPSQEQ